MRFFLSLNKLVVLLTGLSYLSVWIPPDVFWPAGFGALLIPGFLFINVLFLFYWYSRKKWNMLFSALTLLLGYKFILASVAVTFHLDQDGEFRVMSYNARVFNVYEHLQSKKKEQRLDIVNWAVTNKAEIKCFQEYYNDPKSKEYNTTQQLSRNGQYQSFVHPTFVNKKGAEFGLAIFSIYPIVNKGEITFANRSNNTAIFADLKKGDDTVRVINVHLESMHIDQNLVVNTNDFKKSSKDLFRRMRRGFMVRSQQIKTLIDFIEESPHRIILCGDFNDTPYSYSYFQLGRHLLNAFEHTGNGLGFSFNGKLFFLRIDNQFFSENIDAGYYRTYREVAFSDHFPIEVVYSMD
ncbi:endonuclease/exonuclease/phosphatase family protein [Rapidithrix thailandica]|uniref:Endonuclease/exonuclease/phosphatase family protein n=1 Tax=Rapidithrix thailandica TaxID=413964 RepID=A0AAW9RUJ9_9BACT